MPRIKVNESDLSWYYRQRAMSSLIILVPGITTFGPYDPVYVDQSNFTKVLGDTPVNAEDLSYHMAASFVKAGATVLFVRVPVTGAVAASGQMGEVTVTAKYPGTFGNRLKVKASPLGDSNVRIVVKDTLNNRLLENFIVNIEEPASKYYYKSIDSSYLNFVLPKEEVTASESTPAIASDDSIEVTLSGGTDGPKGQPITRAMVAASLASLNVLEELKDPLTYDFHVIVDGGYNVMTSLTTVSAVDTVLKNLAIARGTAVYLVDGDPDKITTAEALYDYTGLPNNNNPDGEGFNTSYAAAFGPWCYAELLSTGSVRLLPGSYAFLIGWCNSITSGSPLWYAPAGVKRATLPFVTNTLYRVGQSVLNLWQNHEDTNLPYQHKVNPIMSLKRYGYVVYGNSTLLKTNGDGATSMLQSFSTRILANLIKMKASEISLSLQFDQIDNEIFAEFNTVMTAFMDQLRYSRALYDYRIIADYSTLSLDDLNSRTVPVKILISPNPAAENFTIDLEISQAGVTFSDAAIESDE